MKFEVGEVAIVGLPPGAWFSSYNGRELTVLSELVEKDGSLAYEITADWLPPPIPGFAWYIGPCHLRKRRPPPDWNALAGVKDKPLELEPA